MKKLIAATLLLGTLLNPLQAKRVSFTADITCGHESGLVKKVENISFLENETFKLRNKVYLGTKLGTKIPLCKYIDLNTGLGIDFNFNDKAEDIKKEYEPEDYAPKLSCEGASPIKDHPYVYIHKTFFSNKNKYFRPTIYSEIEAKLTKKFGFAFGYELFSERIVLENGYKWTDDRLKKENRYNLANLIVSRPYVSLKAYNKTASGSPIQGSLDLGINSLRRKRLTNMGKQMDINFKKLGYFVSFRIGGTF